MRFPLKQTKALVRRGVLRILTTGPMAALWSPFIGSRATVFMFHRFGGAGRPRDGYSPDLFRKILQYLRNHRYALMDLEDLIRGLASGATMPPRALAITFDDGYQDHFEVAVPILAEFDAPAATFLTVGFSDGSLWQWWDQIEYLLVRSDRPRITLELANQLLQYDLSTGPGRQAASRDFTERCKLVDNAERLAAIQRVAVAVGHELPSAPPEEYRPMTWDQARIAERFGIRFGASTVSHPVLSRVDDGTAAYEIEQSWRRIREELNRPMPVFCYPNGFRSDFGEREIRLLVRAGLLGAVTAEPGYLRPHDLRTSSRAAYGVPRFSGPESLPQLVRIAGGLGLFLSSFSG